MMNAYFVYQTVYYQDKIIRRESWLQLCDSREAVTESEQYTNLLTRAKEIEANKSENTIPINWRRGYWLKKNNYYLTVFTGNGEKCYPLTNTDVLTVEISYKLYSNIMTDQLLKQPAEQVIAYFKDRGMTYCPLMNQ